MLLAYSRFWADVVVQCRTTPALATAIINRFLSQEKSYCYVINIVAILIKLFFFCQYHMVKFNHMASLLSSTAFSFVA